MGDDDVAPIIALGKTGLSKFSHDVLSANIACSSRCLRRISLDSAMKASCGMWLGKGERCVFVVRVWRQS